MSVFRPEDVENVIEGVHKDFKVKYYDLIYKKTHTMFNFPLFHDIQLNRVIQGRLIKGYNIWRCITPKEPVNFKLVEETNIEWYFQYHMRHSIKKLYEEAHMLQEEIEKTKAKMRDHKSIKKLKPFYEQRLEEWKKCQLLSASMKQMTASIKEHIKKEIDFFKTYREKQRRKIKHHYKNHKMYFKSVQHELCIFSKFYKCR